MGRLGYVILLALLVAGAAYVFWPEADAVRDPPLWRGEAPTRYRVSAGGLTQEVDGAKVVLDGIERPLDDNRHRQLWSFIASLTVNERVTIPTPEDNLAGYGIGGGRELAGDGQRLRWGGNANDFYLWDGRRLIPCGKDITDRLDVLTHRLDRKLLLELPPIRGVNVDGLGLRLEAGAWRDALHSERPDFNRRINRLYDLLELLRLDDLKRRSAPLAPPLHQVRLSHQDAGVPEQTVRLWAEGDGGLVQVDGLPVQQVSAADLARWKATIAMFGGDYLFLSLIHI